ncbi:MAG: VCBS repeat-containing protein, partial [Candidatus Electrothrix sp. ATG2]|nr:VCBS repeat-containing protein [Candidatus Electrothrix sp. ATG2]
MNSYHCSRFDVSLRTPPSLLFCFSLLLTAFFLAMPGTARTATAPTTDQNNTQQFIITPFEVQTETPHPHLQTGLANILATRVTKRTGHAVALHSTAADKMTDLLYQHDNTSAVHKILQEMGNTYLLAGTLKEKKEGYEITIQVFGDRPTAQITLSQTFKRLDRALSVLDDLSLDIAEKIFSIARPKKTDVAAASDGLEGFHTAHPERMYKEKKYNNKEDSKKISNSKIQLSNLSIQHLGKDTLPSSAALAMAAGDLNNDGKNEFVILERGNLALYHRTKNSSSFQRIASQPIASHLGLHTVYLADLDNNGLQEIYIGAS